jgi:NADH-quinone oxidoreductase subunit D
MTLKKSLLRQIKNFTLIFRQHYLAAHGVLRVIFELKEEIITRAEPHIELLYRGTEKLIEHKN